MLARQLQGRIHPPKVAVDLASVWLPGPPLPIPGLRNPLTLAHGREHPLLSGGRTRPSNKSTGHLPTRPPRPARKNIARLPVRRPPQRSPLTPPARRASQRTLQSPLADCTGSRRGHPAPAIERTMKRRPPPPWTRECSLPLPRHEGKSGTRPSPPLRAPNR
jgi:hypothetical protein